MKIGRYRIRIIVSVAFVALTVVIYCSIPRPTKWRFIAPLDGPVAMHVSAVLPDGRLILVNGSIIQAPGYDELVMARYFNPLTDTWSGLMFAANGKPGDPATFLPLKEHELLTTTPTGWVDVIAPTILPTPFPKPAFILPTQTFLGNDAARLRVPITLPNGTVLTFSDDTPPTGHGHLFLTDPKEKSRRKIEIGAASPREILNLVILPNSKIFLAETEIDNGPVIESLYQPEKKTWLIVYDENAMIGQTTTLLPDGKILVIGGAHLIPLNRLSEFWWYVQQDINSWFEPTIPGKIRVTLPYIYWPDYTVVGTCRIYDPATNTWSLTYPLNTPRAFHTANLLPDGRILVVGGYPKPPTNSELPTNTCEIISLKDIDP